MSRHAPPAAIAMAALALVAATAASIVSDRVAAAAPLPPSAAAVSSQTPPGTAEDDGLKPGEGRDTVRRLCTICHTTDLIVSAHMTRQAWNGTLTWMEETQGLVPLEPAEREEILDYLEKTQGPDEEADAASSPWASPLYRPNPIW